MQDIYKVTFNINNVYGYIAFDEKNKAIDVCFPNQTEAEKIKKWLDTPHTINTPDQDGELTKFSDKTYLASKSKKDFQTVLTRIWENLGVHVDWSFPAEEI